MDGTPAISPVIQPAAGGAKRRDRVRAYASTLFREGEPSGSLVEAEYRIAHSDGGWRWVLARGVRKAFETYFDSARPEPIIELAGSQALVVKVPDNA